MTIPIEHAAFQPAELLFLILMLGLAAYWLRRHRRLVRLLQLEWFGAIVLVLLCAAGLTNLETIVMPETANLLEHVCYCLASILISIAIWKIGREESPGSRSEPASGGRIR